MFLSFVTDKEEIIRFKFRWAEADEEPQDNKLHAGEFRNFRHPEQSLAMTDHLVDEIIDNLGNTVEPVMSSHSYEQPTSNRRPLGHPPKWYFVYK